MLSVRDLTIGFPSGGAYDLAVEGVSFDIAKGERVAIVGESGSGKTTTALALMGLVPPPGRILSGSVELEGQDLVKLRPAQLRRVRGAQIALVSQDPMVSLNPVEAVGRQIREAMEVHTRFNGAEARRRVPTLLDDVRVPDARKRVHEFPHQFSGGMRQRIVTAMALANEPKVLIADEPTTALDVTVQSQILDLFEDLNREHEMSLLLITHNLAVVARLCQRVIVMYAGRVVEEGSVEEVFNRPRHPYTWSLLRAVPRIDDDDRQRLLALPGLPPQLGAMPTGCRFAPRCPFVFEKCATEPPLLNKDGVLSRCWLDPADLPDREEVLAS